MLTDIVPRYDADYRTNGNLLLDDLFGATVHRLTGNADTLTAGQARADTLAREGREAYVVGSGGSSPRGCLGYADCAAEIFEQGREAGLRFDTIVVPNGSSGTHAGLAAGFVAAGDDPRRLLSFTVLAPLGRAIAETRRLAAETLRLIQPDAALPDDAITVDGSQIGEVYGVPTDAMLDAIRTMARSAGLLLDPVYSGKAFAWVLAHMRGGAWRDRDVRFVMTGGVPGLFAYREAIATKN
jgi:D-cysteine desulfhydrase